MDDRIHIRERASDNPRGPDVADNQIDALVEIGWRAVPRTVDLRIETIESSDVVSLAEQQSGAMRRDKPRAAGDQNGCRQSCSELGKATLLQQRVSVEGSNVLAESLWCTQFARTVVMATRSHGRRSQQSARPLRRGHRR